MRYEKWRPYIKWTLYYLILVLLLALQTTPSFLSIAGIKPVLLVPFVVSVCMFEEIVPSAVFSMVAGLLWDVTSQKLLGFNALILLCLGMFVSMICIHYLHTKLINAAAFCAVVMLVQGLLDYLFHFGVWGVEGASNVLLWNILPTAGYTLIFIVGFYYLVKAISDRLNVVTRV